MDINMRINLCEMFSKKIWHAGKVLHRRMSISRLDNFYLPVVGIRLVSMTLFNSKATPSIDANYSCHTKVVELI